MENDKIQEFIKESTETVTKIKILKDNLSKIGTDKEECPICLRAITEDDIKHVEERKANISHEIEKLNNHSISLLASLKVLKHNVELIDKGINSLNDNVNKNNLNIQQKKNDEEKISYIEKEVGKEVSLLEDLNKASVEEGKGVDDLLERYKKFDNEILKKKKEFKVLDNVKFVLSEEGVKSYVIKKILTLFNSKISFYLKELNSNAVITFDQYFDEDIKNERSKPTMYFNYSGAERKAIDLAVMFAFIDMLKMQTNVYYNVQFYDELLDTSLDSAGVENVVRLLNDFVEKYSYGIYVISHRKECSKLASGEVVFLEKNNGITKRIEQETLDF